VVGGVVVGPRRHELVLQPDVPRLVVAVVLLVLRRVGLRRLPTPDEVERRAAEVVPLPRELERDEVRAVQEHATVDAERDRAVRRRARLVDAVAAKVDAVVLVTIGIGRDDERPPYAGPETAGLPVVRRDAGDADADLIEPVDRAERHQDVAVERVAVRAAAREARRRRIGVVGDIADDDALPARRRADRRQPRHVVGEVVAERVGVHVQPDPRALPDERRLLRLRHRPRDLAPVADHDGVAAGGEPELAVAETARRVLRVLVLGQEVGRLDVLRLDQRLLREAMPGRRRAVVTAPAVADGRERCLLQLRRRDRLAGDAPDAGTGDARVRREDAGERDDGHPAVLEDDRVGDPRNLERAPAHRFSLARAPRRCPRATPARGRESWCTPRASRPRPRSR
jgi:hypothetical protein